jgi:hypothetical protein
MMTLTLRHYRRMPLGTLRKRARSGLVAVQHDAWITAFGMRAGKMWQRLQRAYGVEGYVRVWECTQGGNGWHPHFHVLLFLAAPWEQEQADEFERAARARWVLAVEKAGGYRPNDKGCRVDLPKQGDAGQFGRYLFKNQDGKARFGKLGQELARSDLKTGRKGSRMPFEVAEGAANGVADDVSLWHEYEDGAYGVRAMYWSNGMRAKLADVVDLDERSDEEIAAEEIGGETLAVIPTETWHGHVVRYRGRALELLKAAEKSGGAGVRALVESWGLVWGRDVLPAPVAQTDTEGSD